MGSLKGNTEVKISAQNKWFDHGHVYSTLKTKIEIIQRCNEESYKQILFVSPLKIVAWSEDQTDSGEYSHRQYNIRHEQHLCGQNDMQ